MTKRRATKSIFRPKKSPLQEQQESLRQQISDLEDRISEIDEKIKEELLELDFVKAELPRGWGYEQFELAWFGSCEDSRNPHAICIYDDVNDPAHDFCLICVHPRERK